MAEDKKAEEKEAGKSVSTTSVSKTDTDRPSVEPTDPAPGKPKVDESAPPDQKLADGGGAPVFMNTPLVKGIPVVVPVVDGMVPDANLVEGVALAAPVVPGTPEMISNAQAEYQVENPNWKTGDIKSIHQSRGEVQIDVVDKDGTVKTKRFTTDDRTYRQFEKALGEGQSKAKSFASKHFKKENQIVDPSDPDYLEDDE